MLLSLTLIADPIDESSDLLMFQQRLSRIEKTAQVFLPRHKPVNRLMAIVTNRDGLLHLRPRETLFEPLVSVAGAGNQVMFRCPATSDPTAKLARFR